MCCNQNVRYFSKSNFPFYYLNFFALVVILTINDFGYNGILGQKPNWLELNKWFPSKYEQIWFFNTASTIFDTVGNIEMGLNLLCWLFLRLKENALSYGFVNQRSERSYDCISNAF